MSVTEDEQTVKTKDDDEWLFKDYGAKTQSEHSPPTEKTSRANYGVMYILMWVIGGIATLLAFLLGTTKANVLSVIIIACWFGGLAQIIGNEELTTGGKVFRVIAATVMLWGVVLLMWSH